MDSMVSKIRLTNIAGSLVSCYVEGEMLIYFGLSGTHTAKEKSEGLLTG